MEVAEKFAMDKLKVGQVSITAPSGDTGSSSSAGGKVSGNIGGNVVTGDKNSPGVRLVLATAAYTGQKVTWTQGDKFSFTADKMTLTEPVSSAVYLASTGGKNVKNPSVQLFHDQ